MPIGKIFSSVMKGLGAKEGSSSWEKKSFLTPEQQKLHKETLKGYKDLEMEVTKFWQKRGIVFNG